MFYGQETVIKARNRHARTAKLVSAVLTTNETSPATVTYANAYVYPENEASALGEGGSPVVTTRIVIYALGESTSTFPRADDTLVASGNSYLINRVATRQNGDAATGYAIYDCDVSRPA